MHRPCNDTLLDDHELSCGAARWPLAWSVGASGGSGGAKMCDAEAAEARSKKREAPLGSWLVYVVLRAFCLPRALVTYPLLVAPLPRIPVKKASCPGPTHRRGQAPSPAPPIYGLLHDQDHASRKSLVAGHFKARFYSADEDIRQLHVRAPTPQMAGHCVLAR